MEINHEQNRGGIVDVRDVIQYFGSFKLRKDGNLEASRTNNAAIPTPQAHSPSKKIKNQCDVVEENSDKFQWLSEKPVFDHNNIWAHEFYTTQGQELWQDHGQGRIIDYRDYYCADVWKPESFGWERAGMESFCGYPSTSNYVKTNPIFPEGSSFRPTSLYNSENYQLRELTNNGVYDYAPGSSSISSSIYLRNQRRIESFAELAASIDLSLLQEILEGGDRVEIGMLLITLRGSYFDLMTDKALSSVFIKLVDACRGDQLDSVVAEVLSCTSFFISAAFCKQGASSIIRLIKRLKKSSNALSMTQALSTQFMALMTDETARMVIQNCFIYFPNQHNKVLYEKAIHHCQELATDKVGCRALNELINTIAGEQRSRLLNEIADCSVHLSYDHYGNYVVQNVLTLKNDGVTGGIVSRLRGECVELAKQQGGSHVVEKCIEASDYGIASVVQEIVETPKASLQIAQNQFGNYVIQTALKKTKEHGFSDLHESLVKSLKSHFKELNQTMSGKIVLALLKDDVQVQPKWRKESKERALMLDYSDKKRIL
ncbi:hypothetical protein C2S53_018536 [Perilla frutescens var. hirtella]|uniref:PUM-HD domain-containing protein n=1 Tax=Perilla frutescens var. hirtella TaxID=608512 RepID=A0AAD4J2C3_PERFH|nr:hypothetical protein C2S53_018536 [Perilla frutescens var. hirtella]